MDRPKTMKSAILVEQKKPLVIADIELPKELQYGQVLVKVACSGIKELLKGYKILKPNRFANV